MSLDSKPYAYSEWWSVVIIANDADRTETLQETQDLETRGTNDMDPGQIEVNASLGRTYNTGDYTSLRIDYGVRFVGSVAEYAALRDKSAELCEAQLSALAKKYLGT
jgi:hypothetical protein